jgi:hypothetical protein
VSEKNRVSLRFSEDEIKEIDAWQKMQGISSTSEAIRQLISLGLHANEKESEGLRKDFHDMEERTLKTFHKGTRASLGASVALSSYMPALANVVAASYNVAAHVASSLNLSIETDGSVERDLAILEEWRGCTSGDFFQFITDAGGTLSRTGAEQSYPTDARARLLQKTRQMPSVPHKAQVVTDESWIEKTFGQKFAETWIKSCKQKLERDREIEEYKRRGEAPFATLVSLWNEQDEAHRALEEEIIAAAHSDIEMHYSGLVFDINCPDFWREPTEEEKAQRDESLKELLSNYGLTLSSINTFLK